MNDEYVAVAVGYKGPHGWVVDERLDVECFDTGISAIVITPALKGGGFNLTHVATGYFMLGPFSTMTQAREAAVKLAKLFPLREITQQFNRPDAKRMFRALAPADQEWMRQNGARL